MGCTIDGFGFEALFVWFGVLFVGFLGFVLGLFWGDEPFWCYFWIGYVL
jgi:hypothetical protein